MASASPNKSLAIRASAVLTTGEVAATSFQLNEAFDSRALVEINFTLGMLTNVVVRFYGSMDGSTWFSVYGSTGAALTQTLTASSTIAIPVNAQGYRFLRVSAQGTGTVTNSLLALNVRYLRRGSQ